MTTYDPNSPTPTQNLSVSQGILKGNFLSANNSFGVDHYPFDDLTTNNGYHKATHIVKQAGNSVAPLDTVVLFCKDYTPDATGATTDTQLYVANDGGGFVQMTGTLQTSDGWAWVGGMLLQWGRITLSTGGTGTSTHRTGTVTFKDRVAGAIPFPNNCFIVTGTTSANATAQTSPSSTTFSIFSKSATQFVWVYNTSANITDNPFVYWFAVGQ